MSLGGVSDTGIDGNNTLEIKAIGVTVSTFETRPTRVAATASPAAAAPAADAAGEVHGKRRSKAYRVPGCKGYVSMNPASLATFATEADAQQAGYHRAQDCP